MLIIHHSSQNVAKQGTSPNCKQI